MKKRYDYENKDYIEGQFEKYKELKTGKGHWAEKLEKMELLIGDTKSMVILDLGTSIGTYALIYAPKCKLIVGIDISKKALIKAKQEANNEKLLNCFFVKGDVSEMGFLSNSFDMIIACDIVEHLNPEILEKTIKECYRILKIGGEFVIQTYPSKYNYIFSTKKFFIPLLFLFWLPNRLLTPVIIYYDILIYSLRKLKRRIKHRVIEVEGGHINMQTLDTMTCLLKKFGFAIEERFIENTYSSYERLARRDLINKLFRNHEFTKNNIYNRCRK